MILGLIVMITALSISAVAIYYSVSGLVAIFAAAAIPIIIMGSVLEVGKLVTAVWLHWYWRKAVWWLKAYLSLAVLVLMFITSMGIFGFLSKAHIEQTAAAEEGIAKLEIIEQDLDRQQEIIVRAEERIIEAEASIGKGNTAIQEQIDKEQERIDTAYSRIEPAIEEQNVIIQTQLNNLEDRVSVYEEEIKSLDSELVRLNSLVEQYRSEFASTTVASIEEQVQPYNDQIAQLDVDLDRVNKQANEYEQRISILEADTSAADAILEQINSLRERVQLVQGQIASNERPQIQEAQRTIGVDPDGSVGPNTRRVLAQWEAQQLERVEQLQTQANDLRVQAQSTVDAERTRLTDLVKDLRGTQTDNIIQRKQGLLDAIDQIRTNSIEAAKVAKADIQTKIDTVLNTDIPANREARQQAQDAITKLRQADDPRINAARQSIKDLRAGADSQIAASNELIQRLRSSLTVGKDPQVEAIIEEQQQKIIEANNSIDNLTQEKYTLQAEYRKLEAEVGPVKYLAEFIYDDAGKDVLEEAVRWVIIVIIFVFDPLAVLLLIASQATFEMRRQERLRLAAEEQPHDNETSNNQHDEHAQPRSDNSESRNTEDRDSTGEESIYAYAAMYEDTRTTDSGRGDTTRIPEPEPEEKRSNINEKYSAEEQARADELEDFEVDPKFTEAKRVWKDANPDQTVKLQKLLYIKGAIDRLPWDPRYVQNEEQNEDSIWNRIKRNE